MVSVHADEYGNELKMKSLASSLVGQDMLVGGRKKGRKEGRDLHCSTVEIP